VRVAHNKMIDALRRDVRLESLDEGADVNVSVAAPTLETDDELRLMFLCCDTS
jgi:predicted RNA polymerase sigma factor